VVRPRTGLVFVKGGPFGDEMAAVGTLANLHA
jgi:hypothetical protein